tara:strand:- start:1738 stop:2181 length:444 start_codon:yes stop_codon:yes gene_type:complete
MPIYEYKCACGRVKDKRRKADDRDNPVPCTPCGATMLRSMGSMKMLGAGFDKKIKFGRHTFDTNAQLRKWEKDNPEAEVVSKNSTAGKSSIWEAHQEADKYAKEEGFNDEEHMRASNRKQNEDHQRIRNQETPKFFGAAAAPITGKI